MQAGYQNALGYNPSYHKGSSLPADSVTWHQAVAYCNQGSVVTGLTQCYKCSNVKSSSAYCTTLSQYAGKNIYKCPGYRLPTEAEWEYAYRAGTTTSTHKGNIKNCKSADSVAGAAGWYSGNAYTKPKGVGAKSNNWGISDMAGNLWEWNQDWYVANLGYSAQTDPGGPSSGSTKTIRGGAYNSQAQALRAATRGGHPQKPLSQYLKMIGFRCVRMVK